MAGGRLAGNGRGRSHGGPQPGFSQNFCKPSGFVGGLTGGLFFLRKELLLALE